MTLKSRLLLYVIGIVSMVIGGSAIAHSMGFTDIWMFGCGIGIVGVGYLAMSVGWEGERWD